MSIVRFSVHRPVFVSMLTLIVLILGVVSLVRIPVDLMPDITFPTLTVATSYENASPAEIEELITRPIEEAMSAVPGVEEITSTSTEGQSRVRITFTWGTDLDDAANDIRDRLDRVIPRLPEEADRPFLRKFDLASFPILMLGASGNMDAVQLRTLIDNQVKYRIEKVPGVAALDIWGGYSREIHVLLDPAKIQALGIPLDQINDRIEKANVTLPAGTIESDHHELVIRTAGQFVNLDQLRDTVVAVRDGVPVRLSELARVSDAWQKVVRIVRVNGVSGVRLSVNKQSGKNTVEIAEQVLQEIARINEEIPQITIVTLVNTADYIRRSIGNVGQSALYGGLYAILILLLFLRNVRSTAIIAAAIPISIVATFMLIYFGGFTLNLMTLGGLALGVGMLVDNAIVVLENTYRIRENDPGMDRLDGAVRGAEEVIMPVIASTLTTVVVFLPLVFVRGMAGVMFTQLAYVISFALLASLVVALTLIPMMASRLLQPVSLDPLAQETLAHRIFRETGRAFDAIERRYQHLLHTALNHRWLVAGLTLLLLAGSLSLVPLIGTELMPASDEGEVRVNVEMEAGTRLAVLDRTVQPIERLIREAVPEARTIITGLGGPGSTHQGDIRVALAPLGERTRSSEEIADALRPSLSAIPGAVVRTRAGQGLFILQMVNGGTEQVQIEIRGFDLDTADALARKIKTVVERTPGVTDARISRQSGIPERLIEVNRAKAETLHISVDQVAKALQTVLGGAKAGYYREGGDEYDILVKLEDAESRSLQDILDLTVSGADGTPVILRNIVEPMPRTGPVQIERKDQERIVYVSGNIRGRDMGSVLADIRRDLQAIPIPRDFSIAFGGDYEEQQKAFRELGLGLILALLLVYMVMACQYESLKDPLIVMFSVPLAIIGVVLMLVMTNTTFNIQTFIGCIMLGGIVVNNAILLVDHTNLLRQRDKMSVRDAIEEAGRRRLRPILMTALTTMLGLLPLALGIGEGGEAQAPMARAVIGGLCSSMLITLVVIPVVYSFFESGIRAPRVAPLLLLAAAGLLTGTVTTVADDEPAPLELRLGETVLMALERNRGIAVQRLDPAIRATFEEEEKAAFDPALSGQFFQEQSRSAPAGDNPEESTAAVTVLGGAVQLNRALPTGTRIAAEAGVERQTERGEPDLHAASASLSLTQALLRGRPRAANLAALRQAELDTALSRFEFRAYVESLVADVETAYWETVLARKRTVIYEEALALAERQLQEIEQRIRVGNLPETERASAQAETALRKEALINARSAQILASLRLIRLADPDRLAAPARDWVPASPPAIPAQSPDALLDHVQLALSQRPDLAQARLQLERNEIDLVATRNGVLPRLDFFATLKDTGYANSFGKAVDRMDGQSLDYRTGLELSIPLGNREAKARHRRSALSLKQAQLALTNLIDLARVDVENAYIETQRTREQLAATATTRRFQEEKLRAENAKFNVGRSTSLLVAQAQQDLVNSQVAEVEAIVAHLQARTRLYRMDGSLLTRRGLTIPESETP